MTPAPAQCIKLAAGPIAITAPPYNTFMFRSLAVCSALTLLAGCARESDDYFPGYGEGEFLRIASPIAGTIVTLHLHAGDRVIANAPAFTLEQESERAARQEAEARLQRAEALLTDAGKGRRPDEIAAAQAKLAQAESSYRLSMAELRRLESLATAQFISPSRVDEARAAVDRDRSRLAELSAQVRITRLGARTDEIRAAEQDRNAARAQLAQAEWKLQQKQQRVPKDADVVEIFYREGEFVPAGVPVISLLPPEDIKARFFVPQAVAGSLRIGEEVLLRCDGCDDPIAARITFISPIAEYTSPIIYSRENRANLVYMIEARPAPVDARRLHPGQPLEIRVAKARS